MNNIFNAALGVAYGYLTKPVNEVEETTHNPINIINANNTGNITNEINSLEPLRVNKIADTGSSWDAVANDLSYHVVLDLVGLAPNAEYIKNMKYIIKDILLSLASLKGSDQLSPQFEDANFGRHLIAGILGFISGLDFAKHDPATEEGKKALRDDLSKTFNELIENAGLDKEGIKTKPKILQEALYPSAFTNAALFIGGAFTNLPSIGRQHFENEFVKLGIEMCLVQRNLKAKSEDPILDQHTDSAKFADYIVKDLIMPLIKSGDLSIELPLRKQNNKDFVISELNTILSENEEIKKNINEAISDTLKNLNPKLMGDKRQNLLIDTILGRLILKSTFQEKNHDQLKDLILEKLNPINLLNEYPFLANEGNEHFLASLGISPTEVNIAFKENQGGKRIVGEEYSDEEETIELNPVEFLSSIIFKGLPCETQLEKDRKTVDVALDIIENQLKMGVKAILAILLTPTIVGETPEQRRNVLFNGILDRFVSQFDSYSQEITGIDNLSKSELKRKLKGIVRDPSYEIYHTESEKLISRYINVKEHPQNANLAHNPFKKTENWDTDVKALISQAWVGGSELKKNSNHEDLVKILEGWKKQETDNPLWKLEYSTRVKALLAKKDVSWEDEVRQILKTVEAEKLAKFSLEKELSVDKFSSLFTSFLPAEKIFPQLYKALGEKILAFHEHTLTLAKKGKKAEEYIKKTNVKELPEFVDAILNSSMKTIEEMAEKNEIDLGFSFLNEAVANGLKKQIVVDPILENDPENMIMQKPSKRKAELAKIVDNSAPHQFKEGTKLIVKDVLMIVISKTIQNNTKISKLSLDNFSEEKNEFINLDIVSELGEINQVIPSEEKNEIINLDKLPEFEASDVFSNLIDKFLQDAMENFDSIYELCLKVEKLSIEEKRSTIQKLAVNLKIKKIKLAQSNEDLDIQYRNLLLVDLARKLTGDLIPKKVFNSLLPLELQENGIWEKIADKMFAPYITGIFEKTAAFRQADKQIDEVTTNPYVLSKNDKECFGPLIDDIVDSVKKKLPTLDLVSIIIGKLRKNAADNEDFSVVDKLFGNAIKNNGELIKLISSALPSLIESILAFHLNPKKDGMTSQERATNLIWTFIKSMEGTFAKIDHLKASCEIVIDDNLDFNFQKNLTEEILVDYRNEMNFGSDVIETPEFLKACYIWFQNKQLLLTFGKKVTKAEMAAYKKEMAIDAQDSPELFKDCYIWIQTNKIFDSSTEEILDLIIPESLWNVYFADQLGGVISRSQVGKLLIDYFKEGYEHSTRMKEMVSTGKGTVKNEESKWSGIGSYIDEKIEVLLKDAIKIEEGDSPHVRWFKNVMASLIDRQTEDDKPVSTMVTNSVYAILGKLLSGGLNSLKSSQMFINSKNFAKSPEAKATLIGKISDMIPDIRTQCYKLNDVQAGQSCESFERLTKKPLMSFLSVVGGSLNKNEFIKVLPTNFSLSKDGRVVAEILIENSKTKVQRIVEIDINKFVHWDIAFKSLDTLVSDDDWNDLVSDLAKSLITKELTAGFVAPYVEAFHDIQEPLQRKAERAQVLLDEINAESSAYQECIIRIEEMRAAWESSSVNDPFFKNSITETEIAEFRRIKQISSEELNTPEIYKECYLWVQEKILIKESKSDLNQFVLDKIYTSLNEMSEDEKKLSEKLPGFIDKLIKFFIGNKVDNNIKDGREILIQRGFLVLLGEVLLPANEEASATVRSAQNIKNKLSNILHLADEYEGNFPLIAQKIVDEFMPQSSWDELFKGKLKDLVTRKDVVEVVESFLAIGNFEVADSKKTSIINVIKDKYDEAKSDLIVIDMVIEEKERDARLPTSLGGGLMEMVKTICDSIDATIDEYAEKDSIGEMPSLFNEIGLEVLKDPETSQAVKDSSRALVTIALARMLKAKPGQSQEERVFELLGNIINAYDSADHEATAKKWIEEFFPDDLRKEILPTAVYNILTPKFLSDLIIKEYVGQFEVVGDVLAAAPIDDAEHNISRLQAFVKKQLIGYKDPKSSRDGLAGMGGFVKALEMMIMGSLDGGQGSEVGAVIESIMNKGIAKVMDGPQVKKLLDKQFIAEALSAALPMLKDGQIAPDFPVLQTNNFSAESLKLLGIDIKQDPLENHVDFKERVRIRNFELESAKKLTGILFPKGAKDLPVPEVAQESMLNKVNESLANQVARITNRDQRILMAIDAFGVSDSDKVTYEVLEDHLKANKNLIGRERMAENLFKKGLVTFAMKTIDENVCTNWIQPFKWLAVSFVKAIAWCALKIAINRQVWRFISNPANDDKLRNFVWTFLSFASKYNPGVKTKEESDELDKQLGINLKGALGDIGVLRGLHWIVGPQIGGFIKDKNFVDLIA